MRMTSYDAGEDNELSFREGDRIVEIEAASEDWWQGKDQHGNVGLFPGTSCSLFFSIITLVRLSVTDACRQLTTLRCKNRMKW